MLGFDRYSLTRLSLGSQHNAIHVSAFFTEELGSVSGAAIPVETTAFFNDILRGAGRGAISVATSFAAFADMLADTSMHANIVTKVQFDGALLSEAEGSQNSVISASLVDALGASSYAGKDIPTHGMSIDAFDAVSRAVKNIHTDALLSETLGTRSGAITQESDVVTITAIIPPGGELRIDSDTYRVLLNGENALDRQYGDWIAVSRELLYLDIESASGGELTGSVIYTERYL